MMDVCERIRRAETISADTVVEGTRPVELRAVSAANLPEEILHDILLRLSPKSILKSSAVCKPWRSLIRSSAFIQAHLRRATVQSNIHHDGGVQLVKSWGSGDETERFSLYWDGISSFSEYSKLINPFIAVNAIKRRSSSSTSSTESVPNPGKLVYFDEEFRVVGTCNGIVCLCDRDLTTLLWNPCLRKFVILPPPPSDANTTVIKPKERLYAFGYDSEKNDYKVFRSVGYSRGGKLSCEVEIWSLALGSWKSLSLSKEAVIPANFPQGILHPRALNTCYDPPYVRGAVHWLTSPRASAHRDERCIVSFDMSSELFGKIALPAEAAFREGSSYSLLRYTESLAFSEANPCWGFDMWVMKEYGVTESWVKLLTISRKEMFVGDTLGFRKNGELVLVLGADLHQSVDIKTKRQYDFWKAGYLIQFIESFVESIVLLDHPNAISG